MEKKKIMKIAFIILFIFLVFYLISWTFDFGGGKNPVWGVTFSQYYAQEELKLDWREAYQAILSELKPEKIRLVAYWEYIEKDRGKYNFEDLDWQVQKAQEQNEKVILVIGHRVPRWPECHQPVWINDLSPEEFKGELLKYLEELVKHYQSFPAIEAWQVENEPLLSLFGNCPKPDREFLKKEITIVKLLDLDRPIIVTDSGELSFWTGTAGISDIFGTTLYRFVWNKYIGWFTNFYPPSFYAFRVCLVKRMTAVKKVIISELQMEPWVAERKPIPEIPMEKQIEYFDADRFKSNLRFAQKTGIGEIYLWGAEWWYWRKIKGDDSFWNAAQELFIKDKLR